MSKHLKKFVKKSEYDIENNVVIGSAVVGSERFEDLRARRLKERKSKFLVRGHRNCIHNDMQRVKGEGRVGFCTNQEFLDSFDKSVFVCNDDDTSRKCKHYKCRNTKESVEADFVKVLASPAQCGSEYPKLAVLIWFLQDFDSGDRAARLLRPILSIFGSLKRILLFRWW